MPGPLQRALRGAQRGAAQRRAGDDRQARVDRRRGLDGRGRGAGAAAGAVRVGGGDEQAHLRADVGGGELVAGAGRARDVDPVVPSASAATGRRSVLPLPLHVPGVEVRATVRCAVPEIVGATVLTGPAPATVAVALLAWRRAALRVGRGDEHAHGRADVGGRERVRRARSRRRCLPARAVARALPLVGACCCRCRSRCRPCAVSVDPRRAVPVSAGRTVLTAARWGSSRSGCWRR